MLWKKAVQFLFTECHFFQGRLRALPLKYSATGSRLRVQATPWVNFNRWKFFLGYSNIPNPDQPWRGSVLTRKWVNVGMAHHIGKTKLTSCWWLAEDCHVHIQRKACGTVLGQRWAEIHRGKGHIFLIERTSKACPSVSSVGGWPWSRMEACFPRSSYPLPCRLWYQAHPQSHPAQSAIDDPFPEQTPFIISQMGLFFRLPVQWRWLEAETALSHSGEGEVNSTSS